MTSIAERTRSASAADEHDSGCDCSVPCNGPCGLARRDCRCEDVSEVDSFCARCKTREEIPFQWCVWNHEFPVVCERCSSEMQLIRGYIDFKGLSVEAATAKAKVLADRRQALSRLDYENIYKKPFGENTAGALFRAKGGVSKPLAPKTLPKFSEARFLKECATVRFIAEGPAPRKLVKDFDGPPLESFRGQFHLFRAMRETTNYECPSRIWCQVCEAKDLDGAYELTFLLGSSDPPARAYYAYLGNICRGCTYSAMNRTNLFETGYEDWKSLDSKLGLLGDLHRLPCEECGRD